MVGKQSEVEVYTKFSLFKINSGYEVVWKRLNEAKSHLPSFFRAFAYTVPLMTVGTPPPW